MPFTLNCIGFSPLQSSGKVGLQLSFLRICWSSTLCNVKSIVYHGICKLCDVEAKKTPEAKHQGIYVGQTYRNLSERSKEHRQSLKNMDLGSFMFKHWCLKHPERLKAPDFEFKVVARHRDPLSRMVEEGVMISECATLNSKSEWKGYRVARLSVEMTDAQKVKDLAKSEQSDRYLKSELLLLKERVEATKSDNKGGVDVSDNTKTDSSCRKRSASSMRQSGALDKRLRTPNASSTPVRQFMYNLTPQRPHNQAHPPSEQPPSQPQIHLDAPEAPDAPDASASPIVPVSPV